MAIFFKVLCFIILVAFLGCFAPAKPSERIHVLANFYSPPDYELMGKAFSEMEALGKRYLRKGMTQNEVRQIFGEPEFTERVKDNVEMYSYLTSISGTYGYWLAFMNGRLDFFGSAQTTFLQTNYNVSQ